MSKIMLAKHADSTCDFSKRAPFEIHSLQVADVNEVRDVLFHLSKIIILMILSRQYSQLLTRWKTKNLLGRYLTRVVLPQNPDDQFTPAEAVEIR